MNFKYILNKPYKYNYLYKNNKFTKISYFFNNITTNYFKFLNIFNISKKQLQTIKTQFSNNIYKYLLIINFFKLRLDIKLTQLGINKTLKQTKYLLTYGKILINGYLHKNSTLQLKKGDYIQIIPILYLEKLHCNLFLFKNYLYKHSNITNISQKNIVNLNKYKIYIS